MPQETLKKIGKCINKTQCTNADSEKEIEIIFGDEFVCPECGNDLIETALPSTKIPLWMKITIAVIIVFGLGVCGYFLFNGGGNVTPADKIIIE